MPEVAVDLYALAPREFTAARNALARSLAGRAGEAAAVRALVRPDALAHALDRVARERPRDRDALLTAGERLRAAQRRALSGGGGEAMRAAENELRTTARALRDESARLLAAETGRPPSPAFLSRVELALRVAASSSDADTRERLRHGIFARAPEAAGFGGIAGLELIPGGAPRPSGQAAARSARAKPVEARARASRPGSARRDAAEARRAEAAARREEARRARAERARASQLERLRRALARAEAESARLRNLIAALEQPPSGHASE